ncbi:MAG: hypothetical protein IPG44_18400 [Anaerolineales bacterium]|jgi:hypothetical protein|nr:hypothetical protein [Chloroflexota bacterium]MBK6647684.1 hypothetical protein [Anaerolineales bacterium]MCC6986940.1 hypothetical protein [Anaerolineales bacterium]
MIKKIIPTLALLAVILTACGGQPAEPTLAPDQVQGTAISAALTMVAMTQAAIPTNTPLPPTEAPSPTPLPTFTPLPSPTPDFALLPTATQAAASSGGEDNCLHPINRGEAGPTSNIRFENETGGTVTLSLNLRTNQHGQCGAETYIIKKNEKLTIAMPKGEYWAYAWIEYPDGDTSNAVGDINNRVADNHLFVVKIKPEVIIVK